MTSFGDLREWGAIHLTRPFYIEVDGVGRHKEEEQWQTGKNRKLSQCHTLQDWRRTVDFGWRLSRVVTCCMSTEKMLTNRAWFDQSLVPGSPNRLDSVRDKWWRKAKWKKKKDFFFSACLHWEYKQIKRWPLPVLWPVTWGLGLNRKEKVIQNKMWSYLSHQLSSLLRGHLKFCQNYAKYFFRRQFIPLCYWYRDSSIFLS